MRRSRTRRWALALLAASGALAASLASCSSDTIEPAAVSTETEDRGATEDAVSSSWESEFTITIENKSSKPMEIGVSPDPAGSSGARVQKVTAQPASYQPQEAGTGRVYVVPASKDGITAQKIDLLVQHRLDVSRTSQTQGQPGGIDNPQNLLISLPTLQLRFRIDYGWTSQCHQEDKLVGRQISRVTFCDNTRVSTVNIQTKYGNGWQYGYASIGNCFDPLTMPKFGTEIGDPTKYWNAKPAATFNTVTLEVLGVSEMHERLKACTNSTYSNVYLPAMSLGPAGSSTEGISLTKRVLPQAQMPGIDLAHANLAGTTFAGTPRSNLAYANLSNATLTGTVFASAILVGARFDGADVTDAKFDQALLYDVDLSKATGDLPWENVSNAYMCRTKLPQSTIDSYYADKKNTAPISSMLNVHCANKLTSDLDQAATMIVDTSSSVPLTLVQQYGNFDCALPSTVGSYGQIWTSQCSGKFGSSRLVETEATDVNTARTTTTVAGSTYPPSALRDGSVEVAPTAANGPHDGLATSLGPLPGGYTGIICSFLARNPETGGCRDQHVTLPAE